MLACKPLPVLNVYHRQLPGTSSYLQTYLSPVEVPHGNAVARRPVCRSDDAQEPRLHDCGGPMPDARNWGYGRDFHGREWRAPAAAAVRTPRAARSNLHGIPNVPEWRTPPLLDFRAGISGSSPGYSFLGLARYVDHRRS